MSIKIPTWIKIILILIFVLFIILFFALSQNENNTFNKVSFNDNNKIYNKTEETFLDTITLAGMHALNIKNTAILITPIQISEIENNIELKAYIKETTGGYIIFIKRSDKDESIKIISHELVHLNQLISKRLISKDSIIIFDNVKYYINNMPEYEKRPWEIEAFSNQYIIENKITTMLYNR